jgi:hypothetical protein
MAIPVGVWGYAYMGYGITVFLPVFIAFLWPD